MVKLQLCLTTGKFSPSFSQFTTLNPTGCTVTFPLVIMTRTKEVGLAVWDRFETPNIVEYDD